MKPHIRFDGASGALILLDQRRLPASKEYFYCRDTRDLIYAIQEMVVRGAPALGVAAAFGCVLAARETAAGFSNPREGAEALDALLDALAAARPTAVNLRRMIERMRWVRLDRDPPGFAELIALWEAESERIHKEDLEVNRRIGAHGAELLDSGDVVLTYCNAGELATAGFGTALGVIYEARGQGKDIRVIACETRPLLQGARLTAYELHRNGVPVTLACDNACALLMRRGLVSKVLTGADRIAADGDTANKIGTYGIALAAQAHGIPFYIAAPLSTVDLSTPAGDDIPLEERPESEVTHFGSRRICPEGVGAFNFAFDVTQAALISGIVTEAGVLFPPYGQSLARAVERG
ncbi:MAG: S-methyl-5-thioribose-1-phosphate isomerase [Desulfovibrio sp.]|jgi:methylthioribose-1-phosphate isomerase|nr:S-methyl-5-thioribose-1-phosphate isomerase [Desulfovibrio sp.]